MTFLEQRPTIIEGDKLNSKVRSWVTTLTDGRFPEEANREPIAFLHADLIRSMEGGKTPLKNIEKLLFVTRASQSQVFITLFTPQTTQLVKRLLESMFKRFGEHVLKRASASLHMMSRKDEDDIKRWQLAGEFEEVQIHAFSPMVPNPGRDLAPERCKHTETEVISMPQYCRTCYNEISFSDSSCTSCGELVHMPSCAECSTAPGKTSMMRHKCNMCGVVLCSICKSASLPQETESVCRRITIDNLQEYEQNAVVVYTGSDGCSRIQSQMNTLANDIGKLETKLTALSLHGDTEEMSELRVTLSDMKVQQDFMQARFEQYIRVVINFRPEAVLYRVEFMSEVQREELIKNRMDETTKHEAEMFCTWKDDPNRQDVAKQLKDKIKCEVLKTGYDLMKEGLLPDYEYDRNAKDPFINRSMNVTRHLLGEDKQGGAPAKKAFTAEDKKDFADTLDVMKARTFICSAEDCKKYCYNPSHYRVKETGICYPISSLSSETAPKESILVFCSFRCEEKWDERLMCPKCKTFDWKYDEKGIAPYPCPFQLLDNFAQYDYCRQNIANFPVCPITRTEPKMIRLPLCTSCDHTMMPRTPQAPHLTLCFSYDDMPMPIS